MRKHIRGMAGKLAVMVLLVGSSLPVCADEQDVAAFYRGKTLTFVIGTAPGAAYDIVGRAIASQLKRFIPGEPSIVVQNMPGAGSLNMMNYLYSRAPRDGTFFGLPLNGVLLENRLQIYSKNGGNIGFDVGKMSWLGSPMHEPQVMWSWHMAPVSTFKGLQGQQTLTFGATSPTADNYLTPLLAKRLLGANLKLITGYQAVSDIFLAAERGEISGNSTPLSSVTIGRKKELDEGKIKLLMQFGSKRLSQIADVPTAIEVAEDPEVKKLFELWALKFNAAYPIGLPPDVPEERVKALRHAFDQLMQDAEFKALSEKMNLQLSPLTGAEIGELVAKFSRADESEINRLRQALRED